MELRQGYNICCDLDLCREQFYIIYLSFKLCNKIKRGWEKGNTRKYLPARTTGAIIFFMFHIILHQSPTQSKNNSYFLALALKSVPPWINVIWMMASQPVGQVSTCQTNFIKSSFISMRLFPTFQQPESKLWSELNQIENHFDFILFYCLLYIDLHLILSALTTQLLKNNTIAVEQIQKQNITHLNDHIATFCQDVLQIHRKYGCNTHSLSIPSQKQITIMLRQIINKIIDFIHYPHILVLVLTIMIILHRLGLEYFNSLPSPNNRQPCFGQQKECPQNTNNQRSIQLILSSYDRQASHKDQILSIVIFLYFLISLVNYQYDSKNKLIQTSVFYFYQHFIAYSPLFEFLFLQLVKFMCPIHSVYFTLLLFNLLFMFMGVKLWVDSTFNLFKGSDGLTRLNTTSA